MITRRAFVKKIAAASTAICTPGVIKTFSASSRAIKIGVLAPSHCALPIVHAAAVGNFEKNGVSAEIVYYPDITDISQALISNQINAAHLITSLFFLVSTGNGPFAGKATPLVTAQVGGVNGGVLIIHKDSQVHSPKDLAGKVIGIHSPLMIHTFLAQRLLRNYGIKENDIVFKKVNMSELIPALARKEIDAFINPEPLPTFSTKKNIGRDLITTKNIWFKHPCCVICMQRSFFESETTLAEKVYQSTISSGLLINDVKTRNNELAKVHAKSPAYGGVDLEALKIAFTPGRSDFDPFPFQSSAVAVLKMMQGNNLIPPDTDIEKLSSDSFLCDVSNTLIAAAGGAPQEKRRKEKILNETIAQ
ncbi:MAG: ABC transporter substrate-binding protein [Chitinivibrionales bacterium]|nr:ABC transporter substrate-binding protein [Chitinivibrionales bacterium]